MATYKGKITLVNMSEVADIGNLYTWIAYSDNPYEENAVIVFDSNSNKKYVGMAYNKEVSKPSSNAKDYNWISRQGTTLQSKIYYAISRNGVVPPVEIINLQINKDGLLSFEEEGSASLIINNGLLGAKVSEAEYQFALSENRLSSIGVEWSENIPEVPKGWYLWTRTVYEYSDGTKDIHYSNSYHGEDGL
jgi:hypothetical protein